MMQKPLMPQGVEHYYYRDGAQYVGYAKTSDAARR